MGRGPTGTLRYKLLLGEAPALSEEALLTLVEDLRGQPVPLDRQALLTSRGQVLTQGRLLAESDSIAALRKLQEALERGGLVAFISDSQRGGLLRALLHGAAATIGQSRWAVGTLLGLLALVVLVLFLKIVILIIPSTGGPLPQEGSDRVSTSPAGEVQRQAWGSEDERARGAPRSTAADSKDAGDWLSRLRFNLGSLRGQQGAAAEPAKASSAPVWVWSPEPLLIVFGLGLATALLLRLRALSQREPRLRRVLRWLWLPVLASLLVGASLLYDDLQRREVLRPLWRAPAPPEQPISQFIASLPPEDDKPFTSLLAELRERRRAQQADLGGPVGGADLQGPLDGGAAPGEAPGERGERSARAPGGAATNPDGGVSEPPLRGLRQRRRKAAPQRREDPQRERALSRGRSLTPYLLVYVGGLMLGVALRSLLRRRAKSR